MRVCGETKFSAIKLFKNIKVRDFTGLNKILYNTTMHDKETIKSRIHKLWCCNSSMSLPGQKAPVLYLFFGSFALWYH